MASHNGWQHVPSSGSTPMYSIFTRPIEKPDPDNNQYRIVQLENGIQAVLIHDPLADRADACLTIAIGSLRDPDDVPGMAHFCEHMLLAESFGYFIASNGGTHNASTADSYQKYWFSIEPSLFSQALTRLAALFSSPIFDTNLISREVYAVDYENQRNLRNDNWRTHHLSKSLSVPGHPWRKFGTGNYISLTDAARRKVEANPATSHTTPTEEGNEGLLYQEMGRRLIRWWEQEYCAGRMTLAVSGKESLEDLTTLVVPLFSKILNRGLDPRPSITESPWGTREIGSVVFVKTVKDCYEFSITFQIPNQTNNFQTQPAEYIAHLMGHKGPGSIYAYLRKMGWLAELNTGPSLQNREVHTFSVDGGLTREGYHHYEQVLSTIFCYLNLIRASVFEEDHFSEIITMSRVSFRFREKPQPHPFVSRVAYDLAEPRPPEWILSGKVIRGWDEYGFRDVMKHLVPEKCRIMLKARNHEREVVKPIGDLLWDIERWYGTEYYVRMLEGEFIQKANRPNTNTALFLPRQNPYIPENLTIEKRETLHPLKHPSCIRETSLSSLWYKKDDRFWVPKGQVELDIESTLAYATPRHAVLTRLLVDLLVDDLSEVTYHAQLAGLYFSASRRKAGLILWVSGYNDKLSALLDTLVARLNDLVVDTDRLKVVSEQLRRKYENFHIKQPSKLSKQYAAHLLMPKVWTVEEKLEELCEISGMDIERHKRELLSKVYIQALVTGNIKEQEAISIIESVENRLRSRPLPPSQRPQDRSLLLPPGSNFAFLKDLIDPNEPDSSLTYYCQFGDIADAKLRPILLWIAHAIQEPAFSQLRTKEQLGYIVGCSLWLSSGSMGIGFEIQGLRHPNFLEERLELFLVQYYDTLTKMSTADFEARKEALVIKLLECSRNLNEETYDFWCHIVSGYRDFLSNDRDANAVKDLRLEDVMSGFQTLIHPSSKVRKKLSVHVSSKQFDAQIALPVRHHSVEIIEDEVAFRARMYCSLAPIPVEMASGS